MNRRRMLRRMMACLLAVVVTAGSVPTELFTRQVYAAAVEDGDITAVYEDSLNTADAVTEESLSAEQDSSEAVNPEEIGSTDIVESDGDSLELAEDESLTEDGNALIDEELDEELSDVKDDALSGETTADEAISELIDADEGDIVNAEGEGSSTGAGNALKAIGIDTDKMPDGYDDEDDYANPYGKQNITWGGSDEVFAATMGKDGSAIIGNDYNEMVGKKYNSNVITYRDDTGVSDGAEGLYDEFITDIYVKADPDENKAKEFLTEKGYTVINKNLNEGNNGNKVYLGYKTGRNASEAITNILVVKDDTSKWAAIPYMRTIQGVKYYCHVADDLNSGINTGTTKRFLYFTRNNNGARATALTSLKVENTVSNTSGVTVGDWDYINSRGYDNANLNDGAGGTALYLHQGKCDINIINVEGTKSTAANKAPLQNNFMNKTAGGNFDGNGDGKKSQYAMVSVDDKNGKMYLSVVDATNQHASVSKELGWRLSAQVSGLNGKQVRWGTEFCNQYQAISYMNVKTGDFDGNGIDEIAVFNPDSNSGVAAVEVYHLEKSPKDCDIYDMDNWDIRRTIYVEGDNFVSMDAGDLNGDGVDDLVIGCDRDVTVYHGSRKDMLEDEVSVNVPQKRDSTELVDPSVLIIHEDGKDYLCVMNVEYKDNMHWSRAYYHVYTYNSQNKYVKCVNSKEISEQYSEQNKHAESYYYVSLSAWGTEGSFWRMPLNIYYANGRVMSPFFMNHCYRFNNGNLDFIECPEYSMRYNALGGGYGDPYIPIAYDFQVADLNGDGNQTVFYKLFVWGGYGWKYNSGEIKYYDSTSFTFMNRYQIFRFGHYLGAFTPFVDDGPRMYPNSVCDPGYSPVYAVLNTDDDTSCMHYTGSHHVEYSDPVVLAVLSSPPYFKDLMTASGLEGEYAESTTSYGSSHGSGSGTSDSKTISAGVYVSIEASVNILGWEPIKAESEIETETSFTNEYEESKSIDYSVEYSTSSGTDAVVFYSFPTEVYEYDTTFVDRKTGEKHSYKRTLYFPKNPCITTIDLEKYNSIAKNYGELPTIDSSMLSHKLGYPETYPQKPGSYRNERVLTVNGWGSEQAEA